MISSIRAIVNQQKIESSIEQVRQEVDTTQEYTDYINNFLNPYLESEYAEYFFAHENNQLLPGEKIITIHQKSSAIQNEKAITTGEDTLSTSWIDTLPSQEWNKYFAELFESITWR